MVIEYVKSIGTYFMVGNTTFRSYIRLSISLSTRRDNAVIEIVCYDYRVFFTRNIFALGAIILRLTPTD